MRKAKARKLQALARGDDASNCCGVDNTRGGKYNQKQKRGEDQKGEAQAANDEVEDDGDEVGIAVQSSVRADDQQQYSLQMKERHQWNMLTKFRQHLLGRLQAQ
jgi:hypothetical protein